MKRREFIILGSIGATGATLLTSCKGADKKLIPALIPHEEYVPGIDYWKASSCSGCEAGCGILVRIRDGKANKIEGNPQHPINRGGLCARGQAGVQALYNPDRLEGPLRRAAERGSGKFERISWDQALDELAHKLGEIKSRSGRLAILTADRKGVTGVAAEMALSAFGSGRLLDANLLNDLWNEAAGELSSLDIANARYLISFGARFLETWRSPVMHSLQFSEFRSSRGKPRGKFVHVEPRMSMTAANADEWLPAAVGTEALVAMAIAQVIVREGLNKTDVSDAPMIQATGLAADSISLPARERLDLYAPEKTENITDIRAEKIVRIAREFAAAQTALAIGRGTSLIETSADAEAHLKRSEAIRFLNALAGSASDETASAIIDPFAKWRDKKMDSWVPVTGQTLGGSEALLIHRANPAFTAPDTADIISSAGFVVSFSSFPDETARLADLILPDHGLLEGWNIRAVGSRASETVVNLTQPVVPPEFDTRQAADVLLDLARRIGGSPPFENAEQIARLAASELARESGSSDAEEFWSSFAERGLLTQKPQPAGAASPPRKVTEEISPFASEPSREEEYPLMLVTYLHPSLGLGEQANLPALQELPDPMTSVMWGSWIEINPQTARSLGIVDGDLVEVATRHGHISAPALIYPAIRPEVVAIPFGQGHTASGRWAEGRGANPATVNPLAAALQSDEVAVRASIRKLPGEALLVKFGTMLPEHQHSGR